MIARRGTGLQDRSAHREKSHKAMRPRALLRRKDPCREIARRVAGQTAITGTGLTAARDRKVAADPKVEEMLRLQR